MSRAGVTNLLMFTDGTQAVYFGSDATGTAQALNTILEDPETYLKTTAGNFHLDQQQTWYTQPVSPS